MWNRGWRPTLAVVLTLGVGACAPSNASERSGSGGVEERAVVERGDLDIRVEAAGQVEPILVVEVKSKASGEVTALHVETGDRVSRGELLAEVDPRDVRNALAQAEADLEVAEARLQIAESQAERSRELRSANVVTQQELEQSLLDAANARAQRIKARTSVELAREKMGDVTIRAPIDGTIIQKSVEAGQIIASASGNVSGGTTLMLMANLSTMQVRTLVDETDIGKVRPGQVARVQVEAYPDRVFAGSVYKIEPQAVVDQNVTMFPVLVRLDNREGLLKPNMNAEVQVEVAQRQDVVLVANAAVVGMRDAAAAGEVLGLSADAVRTSLRAGSRPASARVARSEAGEPAEGREARPGGMAAAGRAAAARSSETRPAVVFVATPQGPEARSVQLGLNDWDRTQVVRGLEAGEEVILVSVARLRQQQEDMMNRIRERSSPIPGGGGRGR